MHASLWVNTARSPAAWGLWAGVLVALPVAPAARAVSLSPGDIVLTSLYDGFFRVDPVTGVATPLPFADQPGWHLAFDAAGDLLVSEGLSEVHHVDVQTGAVTHLGVGDDFYDHSGVVVEPAGTLLLAGTLGVDRFDPGAPGSLTRITTAENFDPVGIARLGDGRVFVIEALEDVWEVDPMSGAVTRVSTTTIDSPGLIAARPAGDLIVLDIFDQLLRVDPDTGVTTLFSDDVPNVTWAMAVEADGDVLLSSSTGLFRYDAATGARSTLATLPGVLHMGLAVVPTSPLPGDYSGDGQVDAADYAVWRDTGRPEQDYATWRDHFGEHSPGAGAETQGAPEPHAAASAAAALGAWGLSRGRRRPA